jgi:DNA-binding PadR family transcriptional regulator
MARCIRRCTDWKAVAGSLRFGTSENNRKARYYRLTAAGRKQLLEHTSRWDRLVRAVNRVLRPAEE